MNTFSRATRRRVGVLLLLIVTVLLILWALVQVTGHGYIIAAIRDTYLHRRLTPAITVGGSSLTRHVREVRMGTAQPWPQDAPGLRTVLAQDLHAQMSAYKTAAFLVVQDGIIRKEVYWPGFDAHSRTNSNSVAKSFVGSLIGIAVADGKIRSLDQPVGDYLPAFTTGARAKLTVRHLLTMSAATDFKEDYDNPLDFPARAHYGSDITDLLVTRFNPIAEPGVTHKYDSSNTAVLGLVLARATGQSLSDYASEKLWQPMGAEHSALWSLDAANGIERAYCCLYATARDYARLGQLYLNGGVWKGQQLVPSAYVAQAVSAARLKDATGVPTERYGYSWWRMTHRGHAAYYAWGYQGQYIAVIPDKKIVMVRLGDGGGYTQDHDKLDLPLYLDAALLNVR
ncbi:MAG: serine hydrolase [Pseudomonadota bacterium]